MADAPFPGSEPRPLVGVAPHIGTAAAVPTTLRIAVTNAADEPRVLSVAAVGLDATWTSGPQRTEVLAPGASTVVEIQLTPPLGTLPASYPMVIAAQPLDPATGQPTSTLTGSAETVLVVNPRSQLSVDLKPRLLSMVGARRFAVELRNTGGVPATVQLELKSTTHVGFKLQRDKVKVAPGATVTVRGRARIKRPTMVGPRSTHSFTLSARGTEAVRHVGGQVVQRSLVGPSGVKAVCLLVALAVWAGAAVVFIPALAERVRTASEESAVAEGPGGSAAGEDAADAASESDGEGDEGGGAGGGDGAQGEEEKGLQLSGTVTGDSPDGVSVRLEQTSLVDEEAQGGQGVGVPDSVLDGTGMRLASAFLRSAPERAFPERSARTSEDGSWAFPAVPAPGYYLVSFTKPGYQIQRYVVDSSSAAAAEPLEVDLKPGEGSLSGQIVGPDGKPEGGASITITDGTNTAVTNSNSEGDVGAWSIEGLSTPSTYVVTATKHGMSSEARVVPLAAGASGTASLDLVDGVAMLTGTVRSDGLGGTATGLGGLTITVSDGKGDVRTATTLTQSPRGTFAMPSLPSPGSYAVTASGAGFQAQTRELKLRRGQARASMDFDLKPSTARLSGRVLARTPAGVMAPRPNAGLTLSNADHTYKTMSTDGRGARGTAQASGSYEFAGVVPGSYVLTARYFGKRTVHQNVEVTTGPSKPWVVRLTDDGSDGLTASSTIEGSVLDVNTRLPLPDTTCEPGVACLTATVRQPKVPEPTSGTTYDTYTASFAPGSNYLLPDPETNPGEFLRPGLHTVEISAPGYEVGSVDVELPVGTAAIAPLAQLYPAPIVEGTITSPQSGTHPVSCVWVVKGRKVIDTMPDLGECTAAQATRCDRSVQPITQATTGEEAWCALSDADGRYSVQVPTVGEYTVWVQPEAADYLDSVPETITLTRGEVLTKDVTIRRYGLIRLTVLRPGPGDALVPVPNHPVTIDRAREVDPPEVPTAPNTVTTDQHGRVTITGLRPGTTYTIGSEYELTGSGEDAPVLATMSGSLTRSVAIDETPTARLRLTRPLPGLVGRVTSSVDDRSAALEDASVTLRIASAYDGDDLTDTVHYETVSLSSDELGCFAVRSTATPTRAVPCVNDRLQGQVWDAGTLVEQQIATNRVSVVGIQADGFDPMPPPTEDVEFSTVGITSFELDPTPIDFAARLGVTPSPPTDPDEIDLDWSKVTFDVQEQPDATGDIALGLTEIPGESYERALTWTDPELDTPGRVLPGTYTIRVEGLTDYQPVTADLVCPVGGTEDGAGCRWDVPGDVLELQQLSKVLFSVKGATYPLEDGGTVALGSGISVNLDTRAPGEVTTVPVRNTDPEGKATFTRLPPGALPATGYRVTTTGVGTAGYEPGDSRLDTLAVRCEDPSTAASTGATIVTEPGTTTSCELVLTGKLGSVDGTLKGMMEPEGGPAGVIEGDEEPNYEHLGNIPVTLSRCAVDGASCLPLDDAFAPRERISGLVTTGSPRSGGTFSFTETGTEKGLAAGHYLLSVANDQVPAGYARPAEDPRGTVVRVRPGQNLQGVDVPLYATRVTLRIRVVDTIGRPVEDAEVLLHRGGVETPGDPDTDASPTSLGGGTYTFTNVVPGWTTVWIDAPGLIVGGQRVRVLPNKEGSADPVQEETKTVERPRGAANGQVTTGSNGSSAGLPEARVTLQCPATGGPDADFCAPDGTALDTSYQRLSVLTDTDGNFAFRDIPIGTYDVEYGKRGYTTPPPTQVTILASDPANPVFTTIATVPLEGLGRQVTVVLDSTHPDPGGVLADAKVTVTGVRGTPGGFTSGVTPGAEAGTYTVVFDNLRWGCYDVAIETPAMWRGTVSGPTGSPSSTELSCEGADLVVPDEGGDDITLDYTLASGLLSWSFTDAPWPGHVLPAVRLTFESGTFSTTVEDASRTGSIFLPHGSYTITASLPDTETTYWRIEEPAAVLLADGADASSDDLHFEERTFSVTVRVPSLTGSDEARIRFARGHRQDGIAPPGNLVWTSGGQVELQLPKGNWQILGSWPGGPGQGGINVVSTGVLSVVINPFESSTGGAPPAAPAAPPAPASTPPAAPGPTPTPPVPSLTPGADTDAP